jgi:multicomponent Na+:H+ antiporter subunit F
MSSAEFLAWSVDAAFVMVVLAVAVGFVRLARGPTLADRVVALDMMTVIIVAFCGLYAILADEAAFLDVAIVMALVGFLATVALARFAERMKLRDNAAAKPEDAP